VIAALVSAADDTDPHALRSAISTGLWRDEGNSRNAKRGILQKAATSSSMHGAHSYRFW
jgi:hypothetical protein